MCGESFNQAVRKPHLLYNGPSAEGDFDVNKDVYEGLIVAFDKVVALRNSTPRAYLHAIEEEDD